MFRCVWQGICRFASLRTVPMGLEVGKWAGAYCYFTAVGPGENGTATLADGQWPSRRLALGKFKFRHFI